MSETSKPAQPARPNGLVRVVASAKLPVRNKLLFAFLAVTALLIALALSGLLALQQSNARTEQLIRDQDRFSYYSELYGYLGDLLFLSVSAGIDRGLTDLTAENAQNSAGVLASDRLGDLELFLARGIRRFGRDAAQDAAFLSETKTRIADLKPYGHQLRVLRQQGDLTQVQIVANRDMIPVLDQLRRRVYTIMQGIEAQMSSRARATASAYLTARQRVLAAAIAAVAFALLLGYSISSALIWPVTRIKDTLGRVARGDFSARVIVPNRDELGELAGDVNTTSNQLGTLYDKVDAQRTELAEWNATLENKVADQVDQIERANRLRRFLPAQVADLIVGAHHEEDMLGSRRATITVLFADLRGFTAFSNAVPPEVVIQALNTFHQTSGPLIDTHGGTLERFLGDGLVVLFGAPVARDNAADHAVTLARDMQRAFHPAFDPFQTADTRLGLGIGIATGTATLGQIGFENRLDYSAIGPAPNLAARLCDQAQDGQILICETTARAIQSAAKPAGTRALKGFGDTVPVFEAH